MSTFEADGKRHFTGVLHDLSEQEHSEPLREQMFLQAIFNQLPEALLLSDRAGRIMLCNPAVTRVFGYSPEELIGLDFRVLFNDPAEREKFAGDRATIWPSAMP